MSEPQRIVNITELVLRDGDLIASPAGAEAHRPFPRRGDRLFAHRSRT